MKSDKISRIAEPYKNVMDFEKTKLISSQPASKKINGIKSMLNTPAYVNHPIML